MKIFAVRLVGLFACLHLISSGTEAFAAGLCPTNRDLQCNPSELDCECEPGFLCAPRVVCGCPSGYRLRIFGSFSCVKSAASTGAGSCRVEKELAQNFAWLHTDARANRKSALARSNILRASSSAFGESDVDVIRVAYKEGQSHNGRVAALIEQCNDAQVARIAYEFAENIVRLKRCGDPPPASSATCADLAENVRWSILSSGMCAPYSRGRMTAGFDESDTLKCRAEWVRRGIQAAQGHNSEVAKSADYVADALLVQIATRVWTAHSAGSLSTAADIDDEEEVQNGRASGPYPPGAEQDFSPLAF